MARLSDWFNWAVVPAFLVGCSPAPDRQTAERSNGADEAAEAAEESDTAAPKEVAPSGTGGTATIIGVADAGAGGEPDCGRDYFDIEQKPANVLLVLDRSASMQDPPDGATSSESKWNIVLPALQEVISATDSSVNWGLKVYPLGEYAGECTAASYPTGIQVEISEDNATAVNAAIATTTPNGDGTPTGDAINEAVGYLQTIPGDDPKYILLATDGDPSCTGTTHDSEGARAAAITAVTSAANAGFHTFVVGIATTKESATETLNNLANAGLEPRADPHPLATRYYLASTKDELVSAMSAITGVVATCLYPLSSVPPNPSHVGVFIGDERIPKDTDDTDGWNFTGTDMRTIELFGPACDQVTTSGADTVQVVFGCKDDPII